jgi:ribonuclease HI
MELLAAISALKSLEKENALPIEIFSDSKYVIHGITEWVHGWIKNNWINSQKKPVENRDLWERLFELSQKFHITWSYVAGHSGHPANERCDEIATSFADEDPTLLYSGPRATYAVSLDAPAEYTKASGKPFYLSMVSGVVEEHTTWAECEKRVKGKSGVKFKKVKSRAEADSALKVWGAVAK